MVVGERYGCSTTHLDKSRVLLHRQTVYGTLSVNVIAEYCREAGRLE